MRKIQTKMAAWVGLVALVYGVLLGVAPAAAQSRTRVKDLSDLNCTRGQTVLFDGTNWVCDPPPGFVDNGKGTISDSQTGLVWEKKLAADGSQGGNCNDTTQANRSIHCVNNVYSSSDTAYTVFLENLNDLESPNDGITTTCFAGHCDWRVPTIDELRGILQAPSPLCTASPCIALIFGPTQPYLYLSSTPTYASNPSSHPWVVSFSDGSVDKYYTGGFGFVRAVRGGR